MPGPVFGDMMGGPQAPAGAEEDSWTKRLQDPIVRSAMLSFGLQAMTGGWGNGMQQMAAAIGAGAQGAEGTAKALAAQEKDERDHDWEMAKHEASQGNQAANRAQSEKNARIAADSRSEVANIRGEFSMQRAALAAGAKNNNETKQWQADRDAYLKQSRANINNLTVKEEDLVAKADEYATSKMHARRLEGKGSGTAAPASAKPEASAPATGAKSAPTTATGSSKPNWEQATKNEAFRARLMTPEGRAELARVRPDFKRLLEQFATQRKLAGEE